MLVTHIAEHHRNKGTDWVLKYLSMPHLLYQSIFIVLLNMNTLAEVKLWCVPVSHMPEHWAHFIVHVLTPQHTSACSHMLNSRFDTPMTCSTYVPAC